MKITTKQIAIQLARELRKNQTKTENLFWSIVRDKQVYGYKFLRQHPIFFEYYGKERFFIADFYCCALKLVIEIDGGIHEQQEDYDEIRTDIMQQQNDLTVLRFENEEVIAEIQGVLNKLQIFITKLNS